MIDIEKFICSLLADHPEGVAVRGDIHRALKEQGLEYKDGKIVPIENKIELKESDDNEIRESIIGFLITISSLKDGMTLSNEDFDSKVILEWAAWLKKQGFEPNWCHHRVDLSNCSEEYRKAYYDGWNNCNMQHSQYSSEKNDVIKCLINGMKFYYEDNEEATWGTEKFSMKVKDILAWLEKQSKNKPIERKEFTSIPFGAFDSELFEEMFTIPDGCVATIEGRKVFIRKK